MVKVLSISTCLIAIILFLSSCEKIKDIISPPNKTQDVFRLDSSTVIYKIDNFLEYTTFVYIYNTDEKVINQIIKTKFKGQNLKLDTNFYSVSNGVAYIRQGVNGNTNKIGVINSNGYLQQGQSTPYALSFQNKTTSLGTFVDTIGSGTINSTFDEFGRLTNSEFQYFNSNINNNNYPLLRNRYLIHHKNIHQYGTKGLNQLVSTKYLNQQTIVKNSSTSPWVFQSYIPLTHTNIVYNEPVYIKTTYNYIYSDIIQPFPEFIFKFPVQYLYKQSNYIEEHSTNLVTWNKLNNTILYTSSNYALEGDRLISFDLLNNLGQTSSTTRYYYTKL